MGRELTGGTLRESGERIQQNTFNISAKKKQNLTRLRHMPKVILGFVFEPSRTCNNVSVAARAFGDVNQLLFCWRIG
jgi:hypothetical protein